MPAGLIIVVTGLLLLIGEYQLPLFRCPACHGAHRERMRFSKAPGLTPLQAAAIRAWADDDLCFVCDNGNRVSYYTFRTYGGMRPW